MQVSPAPNPNVEMIIYFLGLVCTLLFDFTYTAHKNHARYHTHKNTHSTSINLTNHNKTTNAGDQTSGQGRVCDRQP